MAKKRVLGYDRQILPEMATLKEILEKYKSHGIIDYDSNGTDKKPVLFNLEDENDMFEDIIFNDIYNKTEDNG